MRSFGLGHIKANISEMPCNKREKKELKFIFYNKKKIRSQLLRD